MSVGFIIFVSYVLVLISLGIAWQFEAIRESIKNAPAWLLVPGILPALLCLVIYFSYASFVTSDVEYFGGYATRAVYYEDWDERVSCRHPIYCKGACSTDSQGRQSCAPDYICGYSHAYDVDYHPAEWHLSDSNGADFQIGSDTYTKLTTRWNNKKFVELNRRVHSNDGDAYVTDWDQKNETIEDTSVPHTYPNKIPASNSLLKFREITLEDAAMRGLYTYPNIPSGGYYQDVILAPDASGLKADSHYFRLINAKLGRKKQVRVYVMVYVNKPLSISFDQEAYLQGGNKNEVLITIGVDSEKRVQWARVFGWAFKLSETLAKNKSLQDDAQDMLAKQGVLDLKSFGDWLYVNIESRFQRPQFTPINKDLTIIYPVWACILSVVLSIMSLLATVLIPVWFGTPVVYDRNRW